MTIEQKIWNFFKQEGLSDAAAAGIMGNLKKESGLQPNNLQDSYNKKLGLSDEEYTKRVDNGTYSNFVHDAAGYGLAQWTFWSLKQDLLNTCKANKTSIADIDSQLEQIIKHLKSLNIYNSIKSMTSVREASDLFMKKFENPADQSESAKRARAAQGENYYKQFTNGAAPVQTIPVPQPTTVVATSGMKYSSNNKPLVCMMTNSTCYKSTSEMIVKGVLWHSTGANNKTLKRYVQPDDNDPNRTLLLAKIGVNSNRNDWNHMQVSAGVNAWIGALADGSVTTLQTLPWNYKPWGCGSGNKGSCNNGWIQFEICEDGLTNKDYFDAIYEEAIQLTAYLCKMYNLNPTGSVSYNGVQVPVILCHNDSYQLGLGSNHADVYHWFTKFGKNMNTVRNDVAAVLNGATTIVVPEKEEPAIVIPTPVVEEYLKKGSKGAKVVELQKKLIQLGYNLGSYGADGDFGKTTEQAVLAFQKDHNLEIDGVVGSETWKAIDKALTQSTVDEIYRVRKSWSDARSQVGAYRNLNSAKKVVDKLGSAYHVYNSAGKEVYPLASTSSVPNQEIVTPVVTSNTLPVATIYDDVMIGTASKDEKGKYVGGQPGDQSKVEVYVRPWFSYNWNYVLRPKTQALAEKIARACEAACNNDNIGYNQAARNTLYMQALKVGLDISKITTPCDCDCSSLVSICCICAGLPEKLFYDGNMRVTSNLKTACQATGQFEILNAAQYLRQKDYLKRGDILLNTSSHTVIVLANGQNVSDAITTTLLLNYNVKVTASLLNVRSGPGTSYSILKTISKNTVKSIVEERGDWGKLASNEGWINLNYTSKV